MLHDLNLTATEVAGLLFFLISILGSIFSVWLSTKVKIAQIETTMNLKITEIETKVAAYIAQNSKSMETFINDNKQDHHAIMSDVKDIQQNIQLLCLNLAKDYDR